MPSRAMATGARRLAVKGVSSGLRVVMDLTQRAGARRATGTFSVAAPDGTMTITATEFGVLQSAGGWSSVSGIGQLSSDAGARAFSAIVDRRDPAAPGTAVIVVTLEGEAPWRGTLPLTAVSTR